MVNVRAAQKQEQVGDAARHDQENEDARENEREHETEQGAAARAGRRFL